MTRTRPVSRQRRYQLRQKARGLCQLCPAKRYRPSKNLCLYHLMLARAIKQRTRGHQPWRPGRPGRPPLEHRVKKETA